MSRRLNLGLVAVVALLVTATALAIGNTASVPDAASCVGRWVEGVRKEGLRHQTPRRYCLAGQQTAQN